jgi:hypothetical protein
MSKLTFPYIHNPNRGSDIEVNIGDIITLLKEDGSKSIDYVVVAGDCDSCSLELDYGEGGCLNYGFECISRMMLKRVSDTMEEL